MSVRSLKDLAINYVATHRFRVGGLLNDDICDEVEKKVRQILNSDYWNNMELDELAGLSEKVPRDFVRVRICCATQCGHFSLDDVPNGCYMQDTSYVILKCRVVTVTPYKGYWKVVWIYKGNYYSWDVRFDDGFKLSDGYGQELSYGNKDTKKLYITCKSGLVVGTDDSYLPDSIFRNPNSIVIDCKRGFLEIYGPEGSD